MTSQKYLPRGKIHRRTFVFRRKNNSYPRQNEKRSHCGTFITLSYHQNMIHHRSGNFFHFGGDKNSFSGEIQKFVDVFSQWDNTKITPRYHPNVIFPRPHLHRNNT